MAARIVGLGVGGVGVGVVRDQVLARGPLPVVHGFEESHEVGGYGDVRCRFPQYLLLHLVELEQGVRGEAAEVQLLGRIGEGGGATGR